MSVETVVISVAVSIGLKILAGALQKRPKQDFNENLPDSSYRKNIPRPYNYYRYDVNWIEPREEAEAFFKRGSGADEVLYGRFLGAVCYAQTNLSALWIEGKGRYNEAITKLSDLKAGEDFVKNEVTWLNGSFDQRGWKFGKLEIANSAYYKGLQDSGFLNHSHETIGYRGISCIGFHDLNLSEDIGTSTLPNVSVLVRTKKVYALHQIVFDICTDAGLKNHELDISEIEGVVVKGFSNLQNGGNYSVPIADLMLTYKFFATETPNGRLTFRKFERPGVTLTLDWQEFIPKDGGKLWSEKRSDPQELPKTININFIDPAIDYVQNSIVSEEYPEATTQNEESIDVPCVLSEAEAKDLANWHLNQAWVRSTEFEYTLSLKRLNSFVIGDLLVLPGGIYTQVVDFTVGVNYSIEVKAVQYDSKSATSMNTVGNVAEIVTFPRLESTSGQIFDDNGDRILPKLFLLDIPLARPTDSEIGFYAFSDRSLSLLYGKADLEQSQSAFVKKLKFQRASCFGNCLNVLDDFTSNELAIYYNYPLFDSVSTITVELSSGSLPESITNNSFTSDGQIAFVGKFDQNTNMWLGEYIGFRYADLVENSSPPIYVLSTLSRGLKGTEWYCNKHVGGEMFFLLSGATAYAPRIPYDVNDLGLDASFKLLVNEKENLLDAPVLEMPLVAQSLYPYHPIYFIFSENPANDLIFSFDSRSRGTANNLGEEQHLFEIDLLNDSDDIVRTISGTNPITYSQAERIIDNLGDSINADIYKISSFTGRGFPAYIRNRSVDGLTDTVSMPVAGGFLGFKTVTSDRSITVADNGYWLLVNTNSQDISINLPQISAIRVWVQNTGTNIVYLTGNLVSTDSALTQNETIFLANTSTAWYGQVSW